MRYKCATLGIWLWHRVLPNQLGVLLPWADLSNNTNLGEHKAKQLPTSPQQKNFQDTTHGLSPLRQPH